jgi:hypothetical protein
MRCEDQRHHQKVSPHQDFFQIITGKGLCHLRHLFGSTGSQQSSARSTLLRAEIDDPISGLDDFQVDILEVVL